MVTCKVEAQSKKQVKVMSISEELGFLANALVMKLDFEVNTGLTVTDKSANGNQNNGTLKNGTLITTDSDNVNNSVAKLDGVDDYIGISNSTDINTQSHAQRTISLNFKVDDITINHRKQVIYEEGGQGSGLNIYIFDGKLYIGVWDTQIWQGTYLSSSEIQSNQWHNVVLVLDTQVGVKTLQNNAFRGYLDGGLFATGDAVELPTHAGGIGIGNVNDKTRFHDGAISTTGNHGLYGEIDDVQLYNQSFSDSNVDSFGNAPKAPTVSDDPVETVINAPLTIRIEDLISNDNLENNTEFTLTQVSDNVHGTVTWENGEIIFTPSADFQGIASFEYTIETQGGSDTGIVEINVKPTSLGTNLGGISDWSTQIPFIDGFKSSRAWIPQKFGVWDTEEPLNLDENGWITSLPDEGDNTEYEYVSTLLYRELQGQYLGGTYIVLYDGDGVLEYGMDAVKNEALSAEGRDVIEVNPSHSGILITLAETDRQNNDDYLRNIRVIPQEFEDSYETEIFNPAFIDKINPFSTLRFMDWMETNDSIQAEWQNRPTLDNATWAENGVPVEIMVNLANKTQNDPWFTIPHQATDEYVREFANYVRDNLNPELKVYVEYSNEVWNPQFQQYHWMQQTYNHVQDGYSQRLTEILGIWDEVFGEKKEDVIGVASGQGGNSWVLSRILEFAWAENPLTPQEYGIDAIAIAPYFGGGSYLLNTPEKIETIKNWTKTEADGGVTKLFDELTQGGLSEKTALEFVADLIVAHKDIADKYGLDLLAYEGGQHLVKDNDIELTDLFIKANRDSRMGEIYEEYLKQWYQLGGDTFVNFNDIGTASKWGSWGALESVYDSTSPKYSALMDVINHNFAN